MQDHLQSLVEALQGELAVIRKESTRQAQFGDEATVKLARMEKELGVARAAEDKVSGRGLQGVVCNEYVIKRRMII